MSVTIMFFEDLAPYQYLCDEPGRPPDLSVGWLDFAHPFTTGPVPAGLVSRLKEFCQLGTRNQMRGYHYCQFCDEEPVVPPRRPGQRAEPLGTAEIWVLGLDGIMYAAPDLIIHYIERHGYRPPDAFIAAVLRGEPAPLPTASAPVEAPG